MELFKIGFLTVSLVDVIDILLVAFIMYQLYRLVRGSVAMNIITGILLVYLLYLSVKAINMQLLGSILGQVTGVGVIALIIVFQQETRRFLLLLGSNSFLANGRVRRKIWPSIWKKNIPTTLEVLPLVKACRDMSATRTGAILVLAKTSDLSFLAETGDMLEAALSKRLIESIFSKNSPLHDGAAIISQNKIIAARCVLPVTENTSLPARFGLRHRSAIGITEQTDALAIVVSEETGEISLAKEGEIRTNLTPEELERRLQQEFSK